MPLSARSAAPTSRTTRIVTQFAVATAIAGAGLFGNVSPAQAVPQACNVFHGGHYAIGYCAAGTGYFRLMADCTSRGRWYGQWVLAGANNHSSVHCGPGNRVVYAQVQRMG
jgi:hypothetical protein